MSSWDNRSGHAQHKLRDRLLHEQVRDGIGPFSPFWRERFSALRLSAGSIKHAKDLTRIPPVGESELTPEGDAADAARLVLQADEAGFALHTYGPALRKALVKRVLGKQSYQRMVEAATRPTCYHFAGKAATFPVASTRNDLDLIARAGSRAWKVLGLTNADVLVSAIPAAARLEHTFLSYAALGAGAPALFPRGAGEDLDPVVAALRLVAATALAVPAEGASDVVADLAAGGADLTGLRRLLVLGVLDEDERVRVGEALDAAGGTSAELLSLYGPAEGRVLWAECTPGSGYHTYPDLDIVELVVPETGDPATDSGEVVVTQLQFRGSALLRWRTGDVVHEPIATGACPNCKRTVPRIPSAIVHAGLVAPLALRGRGDRSIDLRAVAAALTARTDLADWRIETGQSARDGHGELVVYVVPAGDETNAAVGSYQAVRNAIGVAPTQVVVLTQAEMSTRPTTRGGLSARR